MSTEKQKVNRAMATSSISSSSPLKSSFFIFKSKTFAGNGIKMSALLLPSIPPGTLHVTLSKTKPSVIIHHPFLTSRPSLMKIRATPEEVAITSEPTAAETSQQIVSTGDDTVSIIVQVLLSAAFVALSILTIGVIYLGVTDFLQKREKDKFEKQEAANEKTGKKKKVRARARAVPRGFGQKLDQEEEED